MIKKILIAIVVILILATLAHFGILGLFLDVLEYITNAIIGALRGGEDILKSLGDELWRLIPIG